MSAGKEENGPHRGRDAEAVVLDITRRLAVELHPTTAREVTLDSLLDRELGFDSLSRVELLARIERAFDVSLTEQALATAETPRDLLRAVQAARPGQPRPITAPQPAAPPPGATTLPPPEANTLLAILDWHVNAHPARPHIYLITETGEEVEISYATLQRRADAVAAALRARDLLPGQTVAIMLPTGLEYFSSFYGVLRAGGIPVPIYPPARLSQIEDHLRRHARILDNARARY